MWSRIMMITRIGDVTISMNNAGIKSMSMRLYRGRNQLAPRRIHSNLPSPSPSPLRCSRSHATMTIWSCFLLQQVMPYQIHVYDWFLNTKTIYQARSVSRIFKKQWIYKTCICWQLIKDFKVALEHLKCHKLLKYTSGTTAWSDSDKGGWLMHCLYQVFNDVTYTDDDLLTILTCVCGKMARDMETNCPNSPHYDKAKSAACVYHRLSKDIYLQPKEIKRERKR